MQDFSQSAIASLRSPYPEHDQSRSLFSATSWVFVRLRAECWVSRPCFLVDCAFPLKINLLDGSPPAGLWCVRTSWIPTCYEMLLAMMPFGEALTATSLEYYSAVTVLEMSSWTHQQIPSPHTFCFPCVLSTDKKNDSSYQYNLMILAVESASAASWCSG